MDLKEVRDSRQVSIMYLVDGSRSRWVNILSEWTRDKVVLRSGW